MKKKTNPVWGGRFKKKSSPLLEKINNSISFDYRLAKEDIKLCEAYADALMNAKEMEEKIIVTLRKKHFDQIKLEELREELDRASKEHARHEERLQKELRESEKRELEAERRCGGRAHQRGLGRGGG